MITLSIAKEFSKTPGFRYEKQSPGTSGEEFRDKFLEPKYLEALAMSVGLQVVLDGTDGYLTSFVEEAFGGLQRKYPQQNILDVITVTSNDEIHWVEDIKRYVKNSLGQNK